jgi:hypothetical protein
VNLSRGSGWPGRSCGGGSAVDRGRRNWEKGARRCTLVTGLGRALYRPQVGR